MLRFLKFREEHSLLRISKKYNINSLCRKTNEPTKTPKAQKAYWNIWRMFISVIWRGISFPIQYIENDDDGYGSGTDVDERRGISFPIKYIENDDDGSGTDVDEPNEEDREETSFEINKSIGFPIQYIENDVDEPNEEDREMRKKTSFEINKSIF